MEVLFTKRRAGTVVFVCAIGVSRSVTLPREWTDRGPQPCGHQLSVEGLTAARVLGMRWRAVARVRAQADPDGEGQATGAHLLWRATATFALAPVRILDDGSYLAELKPAREGDGPPLTVRVIEYTVHSTTTDGQNSSELFCLVTDLLDPEERPMLDLACAYPTRWGCETVIGHHKTDLGEGRPVLRSKDPEGVAQEMWALFAVYQALSRLIGVAADTTGTPPEKISFRRALAAASDSLRTAAFSLARHSSRSSSRSATRAWPSPTAPGAPHPARPDDPAPTPAARPTTHPPGPSPTVSNSTASTLDFR